MYECWVIALEESYSPARDMTELVSEESSRFVVELAVYWGPRFAIEVSLSALRVGDSVTDENEVFEKSM